MRIAKHMYKLLLTLYPHSYRTTFTCCFLYTSEMVVKVMLSPFSDTQALFRPHQ